MHLGCERRELHSFLYKIMRRFASTANGNSFHLSITQQLTFHNQDSDPNNQDEDNPRPYFVPSDDSKHRLLSYRTRAADHGRCANGGCPTH
mmetsp:Transcript_3469/g.5792  ORF Transcript_3469/g.5792 Transcript_3469/m.5792 type:complete len:91 (+) Transcript_3469:145-417(+)